MKTKLLIFGITGDLGTRKLLPAISQIIKTGDFDDLEIIGVSRRQVDVDQLLEKSLRGSGHIGNRLSVFTMDLEQAADYLRLKDHLSLGDDDQLIIYLSVPPLSATQIVEFLGLAGLNRPNVKIMFEKPFGVDYDSAVDVIKHTERYYGDDQIYRIDHYLAKEMAQNIVAFRGGNAIFSHLWNGQTIEKIEITALEQIGIAGRAHFYEQTGALRDLVQGHLMQLLSLTLMDIPKDFDWDMLPSLRLDAINKLRVADPSLAIRGQYDTYRSEVGNNESVTETFVSLRLESTTPKWRGVPLVLTTGKAMSDKSTEIRVYLRKIHDAQSNCIRFNIQPDEGVEMDFYIKKPGYDRDFERRKMQFSYPDDDVLPDAYEHVIVDAIRSRKSLFTSSDEVLRSWEILRPLQETWSDNLAGLRIYKTGSSVVEVLKDDSVE